MFGSSHQEVLSLLTGLGPLLVEGQVNAAVVFLATSSINLSVAVNEWTSVQYETISVGCTQEDLYESASSLTKLDQTITAMSMGGYAHEDYISNLIELVDEYSMWEHTNFKAFALVQYLPNFVKSFLSNVISSRTRGSILDPAEVKIYKNEQIVLSSLNNYFGGFKTYQQIPWVAGIGNASTFVRAMPEIALNSSFARDHVLLNDQTPFLVQKENVLLAVYNPNFDLSLIGTRPYNVYFYFDKSKFDKVVDTAPNKWIFGSLDHGYIAIYRQCVSQTEIFSLCNDKVQTWITVVGNNKTHGSFTEFRSSIQAMTLTQSEGIRCLHIKANIDGQTFNNEFCSNWGNAVVSLFCILITILLSVILIYIIKYRKSFTYNSRIYKVYNRNEVVKKKKLNSTTNW